MALCVAPGFAATNLQVTTHKDGGLNAAWLSWILAQSVEDGTMPLLKAMLDDRMESGAFMEPKNQIWGLPIVKELKGGCVSEANGKLLWEESEKAVGAFTL